MYCESQEKAQSHTQRSVLLLRVLRREKSAVDHILQVPSAEVVASKLERERKREEKEEEKERRRRRRKRGR